MCGIVGVMQLRPGSGLAGASEPGAAGASA